MYLVTFIQFEHNYASQPISKCNLLTHRQLSSIMKCNPSIKCDLKLLNNKQIFNPKNKDDCDAILMVCFKYYIRIYDNEIHNICNSLIAGD